MSSKLLQKLLIQEINEIATSSEVYRHASDRKVHEVIVTKQSLVTQIIGEIKQRNVSLAKKRLPLIPITPAVMEVAENAAIDIMNSLISYWDTAEVAGQKPEVLTRGDTLIIRVSSPIKELIWTRRVSTTGTTNFVKVKGTIFESIRESYKDARVRLAKDLNNILIAEGYTGSRVGGQFLAVGHLEESSVISERVGQRKSSLRRTLTRGSNSLTEREIETLFGPDFFEATKVSDKDRDIIRVTIESARLNSLLGSTKEKGLRDAYVKALKEATKKINQLESFVSRGGSDSRKTLMRKRLVKEFTKGIKKNPRVKVTSIDTTPKYSKAKVSKKGPKSKKPKLVRITQNAKLPDKRELPVTTSRTRRTEDSTFSLAILKAQLNAKLAAAVKSNMVAPRLINRTGRFASSVQVTDVTQTAQGYPSIGYTYMKLPYQTFEPGWAQGSINRDPKRLIDKAIRDVAVELLKGRFYTRRI